MAKKEKPPGAKPPRPAKKKPLAKADPSAKADQQAKADPPEKAPAAKLSDVEKRVGAPAQSTTTKPNGSVVVGIGASAGGLESFKKFFDAMPSDTGLAFVLIQHLDPTHESMMVELLSVHTKMQISQVVKQTPIEPNHVYIAPAGKYLAIRKRVLYLSEPAERRGLRMPIDHFFRSLAEDLRERAICIILSGTGTEGTLGLRAVKEQGGMAMVQEPVTAPHDSMPRSAVSTGLVDFIIPVENMPEVLSRYVTHPYVDGSSEPGALSSTQKPDHLNTILGMIRARTKQDFRCYKRNTLTRRIERRMGLNHILDPNEYVEYLRGNPTEVNQLFKDLLIGVTDFFREPETWEALKKMAIPDLVQKCAEDKPIRAWVPGCSTGEEAYSLVMALLDELDRQKKNCAVQVFATDIDEEALEFARGGTYPESIAADVPPDLLRRFFSKVNEHNYQVSKPLRDPVVFAVQNLIGDAPFSKLDLISCRNLLIYLEPSIQQKIISLFHFGLKPGGYLFLGTSEGINRQDTLFEPVSKKWQIYRRIGPTHPDRIEFPITSGMGGVVKERRPVLDAGRRPSLAEITQQVLLQDFAPASVLVNRKNEVLFLTGPTSLYLELGPGAPTLDILNLAQEGLRGKLREALLQAVRTDKKFTSAGARVKRNDTHVLVTMGVKPIKISHQDESLFLVTFVDEPEPVLPSGKPTEGKPAVIQASADEEKIRDLERDLQSTREDWQSTIEELETSNEELKVSNEEIMSMNEELQSTNEELETSKEELQSLNEELNTVNNQLQEKVLQLEASNNDMANFLASTDISTIFLDTHFCIKRYTPLATKLFQLISSDVGRPISDITSQVKDETLLKDAQRVLEKLVPIEKEVETMDGQCFLRRIVPYSTQDRRIDGVVITLTNITPVKQSAESLRSLNEKLEQRVAERTAMLELLQEVTRAANEADNVGDIMHWALERIGKFNSWPLGFGYLVGGVAADELEPIESWHVDDSKKYESFIQATLARRPVRSETLPGLAWEHGEPITISDLSKEAGFARREAATAVGLRAGLAFPILIRKEVVGVLEFFAAAPIDADQALLRTVGQQLGRVVERTRQQRELGQAIWLEQRHLGQELHDTVSQELAGLAMLAKTIQNKLEEHKSPQAANLDEIGAGLRTVTDQVREIARGMFPVSIEPQGLSAALAALVAKTEERYGIRCSFKDSAAISDTAVATHLFRIIQEAITNAIKHGEAKNIRVSLKGKKPVVLEVSNDGNRFEPDSNAALGMGLRIMRHRASLIGAGLDIQHTDGQTVVRCIVPPPQYKE